MELEYELIDTGIFGENRYFDVFVEYAKAGPEDILISITACNRGTTPAALHLLPTILFRNTWNDEPKSPKPYMFGAKTHDVPTVVSRHSETGEYRLYCESAAELLFTENETNGLRIGGQAPAGPAKDGINDYLVSGRAEAVNRKPVGTKASAHYKLLVPGGGQSTVRLRLRSAAVGDKEPFRDFEKVLSARRTEADEFYSTIIPRQLSADGANVMRQALAGMLWSKQFYYFDLDRWLDQHGKRPECRNASWFHMVNSDVISMPDKWEYPWYAAWDLAFHTVPLALVDLDFAKDQLNLMVSDVYLHPNGQIPAYEWNFSDVNPPVHAWAALNLAAIEKEVRGEPDFTFLKMVFQKLLLNFTWWVNRKDSRGKNLFEGGFLGLDNIGAFDRSTGLPGGGYLEQSDGSAWMALFSQNMLQIAIELAVQDEAYGEMALKFVEHFLWIASAMDHIGEDEDELWDEQDGFFYDVLHLPNGQAQRLKLRSMVGLLPLCATTVLEECVINRLPGVLNRARSFLDRHPELIANIAPPNKPGYKNRRLLSILSEGKLRRILTRMLDEEEFLGPFGIRSLSRAYKDEPYVLDLAGTRTMVQYLPAESDTGMFGGNSNWRGPIWFPVNGLILRALHQFYLYYGDEFKIECPTGSGNQMTLYEVASEINGRLCSIFLKDKDGRRPLYGGSTLFQTDPNWRDLILFYEYFHGDNGAGIGANHQTGWTGAVARLLQLSAILTKDNVLESSTLVEATSRIGKAA